MIFRALALVAVASLCGCREGVLDPKGPISEAERQILFNSLGIMLAIVIPTILATLGVAYWFRSSNERARQQRDAGVLGHRYARAVHVQSHCNLQRSCRMDMRRPEGVCQPCFCRTLKPVAKRGSLCFA
ncbi:cytochrome o ubiquinol oxidaseubiquinol oxidase polypeptide II-like protein [Rhodoplanes sp. Z2-YC6860]|nr:cytochrome o ubiquinol oxidaseubiquinol oxidase polypeptide II-like protein [Rhodoplanes sp. Z2-YC6860]